MTKFSSFKEFYPHYLSEHEDTTNRLCHFMGTTFGLTWIAMGIMALEIKFVLFGFFIGYLFAWVGHYFFEKNRPATFTHPLYSFAADFVMWWQFITGKLTF